MPSSHADRCEPADKTGIATTGCEEDGVDMGGGVHTGRCRRVWEFVVGAQAARRNLLEGEEKATPTFHVRSRHTHTHTLASRAPFQILQNTAEKL